ncbi:MAG: radical SAM protein [Thermoplasmata archaeon]
MPELHAVASHHDSRPEGAPAYAETPFLITWELTRACGLACRHCRADAIRARNPAELTTSEVARVLRELAALEPRPPTVIFTGGDPTERPDLSEISEQAVGLGLSIAIAPSVTPRLTDAVIANWARMGVRTVSISLDGPTAQSHDEFRGVPGTFAASLIAARSVVAHGIPLQINTSVCRETLAGLADMAQLACDLGAKRWEVFFVVPTGRARGFAPLSASETESTLGWLSNMASSAPYRITSVAAPQYRRVREQRTTSARGPSGPVIKEGRGFAFIDHFGNVTPSGYLPLAAGNVRSEPFATVYRESPLFRALRDSRQLRGRCGRCPYREVCGGSRARAYATAGDFLSEDPACPYEPTAT